MSPRLPGMRKKSEWVVIDNPLYADRVPTPMQAACHDGSPCIDIRCDCGYTLHQHESRTKHIPEDAEIASRCISCRKLLVFPPGFFHAAFAQMRAEGWIE